MLEVRIEKRVGTFHLNTRLDAAHETLALLGPSGAGKTMTLQCLAGMTKPDKGYIALDGQVWFDSERRVFLPPEKRCVGLLFQNYALFPNMVFNGIVFRRQPKCVIANGIQYVITIHPSLTAYNIHCGIAARMPNV